MSKWTDIRDKIEAFFCHAGSVLAPIAESALETTGQAVAVAAMNGTVHNSQDMLDVATKSLKEQAPHLSVTLTSAAASLIVHQAAQEASQACNAPLNVPPAVAPEVSVPTPGLAE